MVYAPLRESLASTRCTALGRLVRFLANHRPHSQLRHERLRGLLSQSFGDHSKLLGIGPAEKRPLVREDLNASIGHAVPIGSFVLGISSLLQEATLDDELDALTDEQQAFLRALALISPSGKIKNNVPKQMAEEAYGVTIEQSNISRRILDPLEEEGYIEWEHVSGKPNLVETTDKFESDVLKPILEDLAERTGVPRSVLRSSFSTILDDLDSDSTYEKGVALETLAIKIGRLLGLEFVGWRVRGRETGGSEVDVVMDDVGELFNRVQIQCKNITSQLETKHVAREVGISRMLQTNSILMIARSGTSGDARRFANRVMQHENISIQFLTGEDLEQLDQDTTHLLHALGGESRKISHLKRLGESEYVTDDEESQLDDREEAALEKFQEEIHEASANDAKLDEF